MNRFPTSFSFALVVATALLAAACVSSTGSSWTFQPAAPTSPAAGGSPGASPGASPGGSPAASPGGSPGSSPSGNSIELTLTADLQIQRDGQKVAEIAVKKGQTYTFRVTNTAGYAHNFWIGTEEQLKANATDQMTGLPDFPSGTQEFDYTFDSAGPLAFGCTIAGHLQSMYGTFKIEP
ncbi:MAG TPA: plastocyanin/azurin family copper-binding protein [Candidatus Limnocylindrales bacterium]|nr:plastocyanin/azurin family copper-binding protein [Candidatus Limnocylindrales bacterium]